VIWLFDDSSVYILMWDFSSPLSSLCRNDMGCSLRCSHEMVILCCELSFRRGLRLRNLICLSFSLSMI